MNKSKLSYSELIELHKCYNVGSLKEEDISSEDLIAVKEFNINQTTALEQSIENDRIKIMEIRNKYENL